MSGYGEFTARCGRCGDSYTGTGVVGDIKAERWLGDHHEFHCAKRTRAERDAAHEKIRRRIEVQSSPAYRQMMDRIQGVGSK